MKTSKRKFEGLLIIDHRDSPGLTPEQVRGHGPAIGKGQFFEAPTLTCRHCTITVVLNPLRNTPRHYCQKCDDYICDPCSALPCMPFQKIVDETMNQAIKGLSTDGGIIIP